MSCNMELDLNIVFVSYMKCKVLGKALKILVHELHLSLKRNSFSKNCVESSSKLSTHLTLTAAVLDT